MLAAHIASMHIRKKRRKNEGRKEGRKEWRKEGRKEGRNEHKPVAPINAGRGVFFPVSSSNH